MFAVDTELYFSLSIEVDQTLVVDVIVKPRVFFLVLVVCDEVHLTASFFSYRCGGCPYWARTIQRRIRKGLHPFPNKNKTSLKVSWSPGGFFQNMSLISLGHDFNGGNASPPIAFKSLVFSSPISFPHKSRISSRYNFTDAMSANKYWLLRMSLYSRHTTVYTSCHANSNL